MFRKLKHRFSKSRDKSSSSPHPALPAKISNSSPPTSRPSTPKISNSSPPTSRPSTPKTAIVQVVPSSPAASSTTHIARRSQPLWEQALSRLSAKERARIVPLGTPENRLETLNDFLAAVTDKRDQVIRRQSTVVIRGKPTVLRHVADKIINSLQKVIAVGDILSQYDPVLLAPPWAVMRFLMQLGVNDSEKMGVILVAVEKLTNLLNRCELYESLHIRNTSSPTKGQTNLAVALVELYAAILEFLADCRDYLTQNTAVRSLSIVQVIEMTKVESAERVVALGFEVAEAENQRHAHTELTEMVQATLRTMLKEISAPLKGIGDNVSFVRDAIEDKKRIKILHWYSKVEYAQHHNRAREDRVKDTGDWLFNHEEYRKWSNSDKSQVLWLHGIPGSGKTKLASAVIDRLSAQLQPGRSVAYHYCSRGEADRATVESILRSFIRQLSIQGPGAGGIDSNVVDDYNRRSQDGFTSGKPNLTECCSLLSSLLRNRTEPCCLVIDALDETDKANRKEFLSSLFATAKAAPVKVEIFITSRDEQDIVRWMKSVEDLPSLYIGAGAKDNAGDLERYVRSEIDRVIANADLLDGNVDDLLREKICNTLISRADAMFLWCRYQIIHLCSFEFRSEVESELDVLPRTMDETYSRIYDVILKQKGMSLAIGIASLSWVTWGDRPLTVPEFLDAIYLEVQQKIKLSRDELTEDLVQKCSGYMVVADVQAGVFRPAHLTIVEYIEARQSARFFSFHKNAALACLRRLIEHSNPRLDRGIPGDSLKSYAVIYWWSHTHRSSPESTLDAELIQVLTKFFGDAAKPGKPYLYWYNAAKEWHAVTINSGPTALSDELNHVFSDPVSPLFSAAQWGLYIPSMWESDFNPEIRNTGNESLLYLASTCPHKRKGGLGSNCGHFDVARRILERGADANGEGGYNGYALAQAIDSADIKLVDILLKHGAKVDVRASEWSSMLQLAAWRESYDGSEGITQLLIDSGADVNQCSGYYHTALQACAEVGSTDMVRFLLEKGADPNILGGRWNSAIQASLMFGRDEVTNLLLKAGASVTVRDNDPNRDYATALHTACDGDPTMEIFEELISHMTLEDINGPPCGYHGIPLCLAAMNEDRYPLVDHLLEAGADPNLTGGVFGSFAGSAAYHFTLDNLTKAESIGADCDLPAGYLGTPLALACWSSHVPADAELISWFLHWGADVNRLHGVYGTPLQCAAANGKLEYVQQLLAARADVNLFSPQGYGSALQAAISTGSHEIEALLRSKGATLNPAFGPSTDNPPRGWSRTLCEPQITVSDDGLTASYFTDNWIPAAVLADNPIPLSCEYYYFEVTVLLPQPGDHPPTTNPRLAIGLALDGIYMRTRPGMNTCVESWGYHSEDGGTYAALGIDPAIMQHKGQRWKEGDTVGMGVFPRRRLAFYTKNGIFMGIGGVALKGRLHPAVGMSTEARLRANFGQEEFMYKGRKEDLELTADMVGKCGEIRKDESLLFSKYG